MGQGGFAQRVKTVWSCMDLAVDSLYLELGGHFSCFCINEHSKQLSHLVVP